jgi:hypothetical protein
MDGYGFQVDRGIQQSSIQGRARVWVPEVREWRGCHG